MRTSITAAILAVTTAVAVPHQAHAAGFVKLAKYAYCVGKAIAWRDACDAFFATGGAIGVVLGPEIPVVGEALAGKIFWTVKDGLAACYDMYKADLNGCALDYQRAGLDGGNGGTTVVSLPDGDQGEGESDTTLNTTLDPTIDPTLDPTFETGVELK